MKTLFLTQDFPPDLGGMARLYGEICRHLPAGGVEVSTVAAEASSAGPAQPDVAVHRMPFPFREAGRLYNVVRWARWTRWRLARGDVSLIQAGNVRPTGYIALWARIRCGVPYVLYVHGNDLLKEERKSAHGLRGRWTARSILGNAAAIIANSRATADLTCTLLARLGIEPGAVRVRVVHPGTDPERFRPGAPGADVWRERLGLRGRRVLLTVARLVPRKGIDVVLAGLPALAARDPGLVYLVAGTGPDRPRLERLAAELGVSDRVRFLGAVGDDALPGLYAAADLFVLPAREEPRQDVGGFGIVYCEAAATGLPVVAGASGGIADAVRDGETGILVPPEDPATLTAAIERILYDPGLRRRMGEAGRRAVEDHYHWKRAGAEIWRILEEVAAAENRRRPRAGAGRPGVYERT